VVSCERDGELRSKEHARGEEVMEEGDEVMEEESGAEAKRRKRKYGE